MQLFIVQEEFKGLVEEPRIFANEEVANAVYIACINENCDTEITTIEEAIRFMENYQECGYAIKYWEKESGW